MKDSSLLLMVVQFAPIVFDDLNLILAVPLVCRGMGETCIFITLYGSPDFAPLLPHQKFCVCHPAEDADNDGSEISFRRRQGTPFFNVIHQVDHNPAVSFLLSKVGAGLPLLSESKVCFFELGSKGSSRLTITHPTIPS